MKYLMMILQKMLILYPYALTRPTLSRGCPAQSLPLGLPTVPAGEGIVTLSSARHGKAHFAEN